MRRRTIEDVPTVWDVETDGEVWATIEMPDPVREAILTLARREHQSIRTAAERLITRALRAAIKRWEVE